MDDRRFFLEDQVDFIKQQIDKFNDNFQKMPEQYKELEMPIYHQLVRDLRKYEEELERLDDN
ncbi:MAG: hypothetical protein IKQ44_00660 [Lachnospiraceae bacterium]|nr:hypothetical protein [Lachnospiraceae bacterium]